MNAAELRLQADQAVAELVLLRAEPLRSGRLLDLTGQPIDLLSDGSELGGEVLRRRRGRRQSLDLVEECPDLARLRCELRRVPSLAAPTASAAAACGDKEDECARENRPNTTSTRRQSARTVAP